MNSIKIKQKLFEILLVILKKRYSGEQVDMSTLSEDQLFNVPDSLDHGFLSTNIVMQIFPLIKSGDDSPSNPGLLANIIAGDLTDAILSDVILSKLIKNVSVAGPGFINFYENNNLYIKCVEEVVSDPGSWGKSSVNIDKNILIEFTDPNPFKEFHVGHLMSNCIGESLSRLYEFTGADVHRLCYQGDVGMHVAKTIWAWKNDISNGLSEPEIIADTELREKVKMLGRWYSQGSKAYVDGTDKEKEEIKQINKLVFSKEDGQVNTLYEMGRRYSLEAFDIIYKKLGTRFEKFYFESETGKLGQEVVLDNVEKIFEKSNGAVIFPGEKYGLHDRVFINSQGLPTYEAKELGLAKIKDKDFVYDQSIVITGNEVNDYFKVLLKAIELLDPQISKKTIHVGHGMLRLPEGKMSSRTGKVLTGETLIEEVMIKVMEHNSDDKELCEILAISAIKFSMLRQNIGKDIVFNINESVSLNGATGVYLQYAHARACSLLNKASFDTSAVNFTNLSFTSECISVYRALYSFPSIVSQACQSHSPSTVVGYLLKLAQAFNSYYNENQIIGSKNEEVSLALTFMVKSTLANGLEVLGITPVNKM